MTMHADDHCARCGHERFMHLNHRGEPRSCVALDTAGQCPGFVEEERRFTLAEVEAAWDRALFLDGVDVRLELLRAALTGQGEP